MSTGERDVLVLDGVSIDADICAVTACGKPKKASGWCAMHYWRWRQHGNLDYGRDLPGRFWHRVVKTDSCWLWTGRLTDGYGKLMWNGHQGQAHRYSYELHIGPIPKGLVLDHLCSNRAYVRPDHLEPVPLLVNIRRGPASRNHCRNGHPYTPDNTRIRGVRRQCVICNRRRTRDWARQKREAVRNGR